MAADTQAKIQYALAILGLAAAIVLYQETLQYLGRLFGSVETYGHWWLIVLISVYLTFRVFKTQGPEPGPPALWAAVPILLVALAWVIGQLSSTMLLQVIFLPVLLLSIVALTLGSNVGRVLAFPVLYLYFAIPIWSYFGPVLQDMTIFVAFHLFDFATSLPVFLDGIIIHVPAGRFEVSEGCSGLHYFVVAGAIAALGAYLFISEPIKRFYFVFIAVLLSVLSNWVRVAALILIGQATNMQHYLIQESHIGFGWVLFVLLVMLPQTILLSRLADDQKEEVLHAEPQTSQRSFGTGRVAVSATLLAVIGLGPLMVDMADRDVEAERDRELPPSLVGWDRHVVRSPTWEPELEGVDSSSRFEYRGDSASVEMSMHFFRSQNQEEELVGGGSPPVASGGWVVLSDGRRTKHENDVSNSQARQAIIADSNGGKHVLWYWYEIGGNFANSGASAKYWQVVGAIRGENSAYLFALISECGSDCGSALMNLDLFLAEVEKNGSLNAREI